jgi:hypothetical protein
MAWWVSWALSILGVIGIYLTGRKKWYGFAVGIANECAWVFYAVSTKQWGFIFGSTIYISVYSLNINKWLSDERKMKIRNMFHVNLLSTYKKGK